MDSHEQSAQRIEDSSEPRHSTEASQVPHECTTQSEKLLVRPVQDLRSRSKDIKELHQLGAVDFFGTTDPVEVET